MRQELNRVEIVCVYGLIAAFGLVIAMGWYSTAVSAYWGNFAGLPVMGAVTALYALGTWGALR